MKTWQQFKRRDGRISTDSMQIDKNLYEEIQRDAIESLAPKLQVIASTFPIPENAGEVKEALERHVNDMNKIEQCEFGINGGWENPQCKNRATRITDTGYKCCEIHAPRINGVIEARAKLIPLEQPPTSTPSLDESKLGGIVSKACEFIYRYVTDIDDGERFQISKQVQQAALKYNASLLAQQKIDVAFWKQRDESRVATIQELELKLSTAEQTGYERGVKKCLELALEINDGHEWPVSRAILNLLNKKGTE